MTRKAVGPDGKELQSDPNPSEVRVGVTTRTDVQQKFGAVDAHWPNERLFIGHWAHSGMGVGGDRSWGGRAMLVQFDEHGIVEKFKICGEGCFLANLPSFLRGTETQPNSALPIERTASVYPRESRSMWFPGHGTLMRIVIEKDYIELNDWFSKAAGTRLLCDQITKFVSGFSGAQPHPGEFHYQLRLREPLWGSRTLGIDSDAETAAYLVRCHAMTHP